MAEKLLHHHLNQGLTTYCTRGENANHYTTDAVQSKNILPIFDKDIEQKEPISKIFHINRSGVIVIL
jgi:hypothetical protein